MKNIVCRALSVLLVVFIVFALGACSASTESEKNGKDVNGGAKEKTPDVFLPSEKVFSEGTNGEFIQTAAFKWTENKCVVTDERTKNESYVKEEPSDGSDMFIAKIAYAPVFNRPERSESETVYTIEYDRSGNVLTMRRHGNYESYEKFQTVVEYYFSDEDLIQKVELHSIDMGEDFSEKYLFEYKDENTILCAHTEYVGDSIDEENEYVVYIDRDNGTAEIKENGEFIGNACFTENGHIIKGDEFVSAYDDSGEIISFLDSDGTGIESAKYSEEKRSEWWQQVAELAFDAVIFADMSSSSYYYEVFSITEAAIFTAVGLYVSR